MLIPKSYVTKLIGSKGCMIQEIANDSGGATIKILSTKKSELERDLPEIIVSIAGNIGPMQDAACIIVEQMEIFKNGGPVLSTGKAISQNIVNQFKNSIKFSGRKIILYNYNNIDNHGNYDRDKDKFTSKKRYRSASRDFSKSSHSDNHDLDENGHDNKDKPKHRDYRRGRSRSRSHSRKSEERVDRGGVDRGNDRGSDRGGDRGGDRNDRGGDRHDRGDRNKTSQLDNKFKSKNDDLLKKEISTNYSDLKSDPINSRNSNIQKGNNKKSIFKIFNNNNNYFRIQ